MSSINIMGSYSGIDKSMIDQIMVAEKMPFVQMSKNKSTVTEKQNAWRDVNTRLNSLFEKIKTLQNSDTFLSKAATSTNDKTVTMSPSINAITGTYKVNVNQLASNTSIISGEVSLNDGDISKELGITGNFIIKNSDGTEASIGIDIGDSLKGIVLKINNMTMDKVDGETKEVTKGTGIRATIINNKLVLSDEKTGERAITLIDDENNTLSKLGLHLDESENDTGRTEIIGKNALFNINGVNIERSSNIVTDAVENVTINLLKEHGEGEYDTVNVNIDVEKITKEIKDFVDQYNSTMKFIEDKLKAGDPEIPGSKGTLAGDSSLMRLHSSLRNMVTSSLVNDNTDIKDISQLGVSTIDKFGKLQFDSSKFTKALSQDINNVINFFYSKDSDDKELGFVSRINTYIDGFISNRDGIIKTKTESYDRTLKDLNRQIENFNARMERKESYYIKMFSALDVALMQAESQMSWLQGQIDSMNASGLSKRGGR